MRYLISVLISIGNRPTYSYEDGLRLNISTQFQDEFSHNPSNGFWLNTQWFFFRLIFEHVFFTMGKGNFLTRSFKKGIWFIVGVGCTVSLWRKSKRELLNNLLTASISNESYATFLVNFLKYHIIQLYLKADSYYKSSRNILT